MKEWMNEIMYEWMNAWMEIAKRIKNVKLMTTVHGLNALLKQLIQRQTIW